ncbi:MAG TPA: glycosyltransferase 87 family protein [Candidatus Xenobia bacterium]
MKPTSSPATAALPGPALAITTALLVATMFWWGRQPHWAGYCSADVGVYQIRLDNYLLVHSLQGEYQPGALFFFWLTEVFSHVTHIGFCDALELVNCLLLALHLAFINEIGGRISIAGAVVLLLAAGPISMYRFELVISLLLLAAWWAWQQERPLVAGFLLGLGVTVKVYPLVLIPLFLGGRKGLRVVAGSLLGLLTVMLVFVAGGGSWHEVVTSLEWHEHKPVALESVVGTGLQWMEQRGWIQPAHVDTYGIHGFELPDRYRVLPTALLVVAIMGTYLLAWRSRPYTPQRGILYLASVLASVVVVSTLYVAQYLLWMVALVALLNRTGLPARAYWGLIVLLAVAMIAQQYIFPCHYDWYLRMVDHDMTTRHVWLPRALYGGKLALVLFYVALQMQTWYYGRDRAPLPTD